MTVVAGNGTAGVVDGKGAEARFNKPIRWQRSEPSPVVVADISTTRSGRVEGRTVRTLAGAPDRKGHRDV